MCVHPSTSQLRGEKPHVMELLVPQQNISSRLMTGVYLDCIYIYPQQGKVQYFHNKNSFGCTHELCWYFRGTGVVSRQDGSVSVSHFSFTNRILLSEQLSCRSLAALLLRQLCLVNILVLISPVRKQTVCCSVYTLNCILKIEIFGTQML